ncbi:MAG: sugar phosphate isomerase/epimerase [Clostridia bacterium]|nr:sugar phosphate isomerase/epimerase [Clostridia bacterium]
MSWYTFSGFADEIDVDLNVQMDVLESIGIRYLEPRGCGGKNVSLLTEEEAKEIKKGWDKRGFRVSAVGSPVGKVKLDVPLEDDLQVFRRVLKTAEIFDTKYIRVFTCLVPEDEPAVKFRDRALSRMQAYVDAAKGHDVILLHENEGGYIYGRAPEQCLDIFESIGSDKLRATFDAGNFSYAGYDALKAYHMLKEHVEYIHIKDAKSDMTIVPPGMGDTDYPAILRELRDSGRNYFLSMEPHLSAFEGLADIDGSGIQLSPDGNKPEKFKLAHKAICDILKAI